MEPVIPYALPTSVPCVLLKQRKKNPKLYSARKSGETVTSAYIAVESKELQRQTYMEWPRTLPEKGKEKGHRINYNASLP